MRIGIDLDDTVVDSSKSFDRVMKKYNVPFYKSFKEKWTLKEAGFILSNYQEEIIRNAEVKDNAINIINYLNSLGHEIIVITARDNSYAEKIEDITIDFIINNNLNVAEIYFGEWEKAKLAKEIGIDLMIDDSHFVYNNMLEKGIECICFGDKIKTWKKVLKYVMKKEEEYGKNYIRRKNYRGQF